jgi:hypothetical protein
MVDTIYCTHVCDSHDYLTLTYDTQKWNSIDCYQYIQKSVRPSNG